MSCNCGNKRFPMSRSWERPTTPVIKRKKKKVETAEEIVEAETADLEQKDNMEVVETR